MGPVGHGDDATGTLPVFGSFAQIADQDSYGAVPADWVVGIADVVDSTAAIARGDYKAVNMAGAAVIAAVSNALGTLAFHYVFGGDGASFVVPAAAVPAAREALAATAVLVREELGLSLRVALVPVAAIRAGGSDIRLARFALSSDVSQTMFSGGGLAWAEARLKEGLFALEPAAPGARPDLTGLSCRFEPMRTRRGLILSLIVRPTGRDELRYRFLIADLLELVEDSPDMARPVPPGGPALTWPPAGLPLEIRTARSKGMTRPVAALAGTLRAFVAFAVLRWRIPLGRFHPGRYLRQLVANSDYRKYDDGLRMTIDCTPDLAEEIEARLDEAAREGFAWSGLHRQDSALMTCITPDATRGDHIHFVDGADGGYAAAAAALKRSLAGS